MSQVESPAVSTARDQTNTARPRGIVLREAFERKAFDKRIALTSISIIAILAFLFCVFTTPSAEAGQEGDYTSYPEMVEHLEILNGTYPDIVGFYNLSEMYGTPLTYQNRTLWAVKLSDNQHIEEDNETDVLYMGAHHAREWISTEVVLDFLDYMVENYEDDVRVNWLVNTRQMWFIPMVNPDGVTYSIQRGDLDSNGNGGWRKNLRDNNGNGEMDDYGNQEGDGVDLNRNYPFMWHDLSGSVSADPDDGLYHGPYETTDEDGDWQGWDGESWNDDLNQNGIPDIDWDGPDEDANGDELDDYDPEPHINEDVVDGIDNDDDGAIDEDRPGGFTEPETITVAALALDPDHDFKGMFSYHSRMEYIMPPWGYTSEPIDHYDQIMELGDVFVDINGYTLDDDYHYSTSGDAVDWFYFKFNTFSYTVELATTSQGFIPPEEDIEDIEEENLEQNLIMAEFAGVGTELRFLDGFEDNGKDERWEFKGTNNSWAYRDDAPPGQGGSDGISGFYYGSTWGYSDDASAILLMADPVDLSGLEYPKLSFWQRYDFETGFDGTDFAVDGGFVEVRHPDRGWEQIYPASGYPLNFGNLSDYANNAFAYTGAACYSGQQEAWERVVFDLSDYAGLEIEIQFHVISDADIGFEGWNIDNVAVYGGAAPQRDFAVFVEPGFGKMQPGESRNFSVEISNIGESGDTITLSVVDPVGGWHYELADDTFELNPAGSATTNLTITSPDNATGGQYDIHYVRGAAAENGPVHIINFTTQIQNVYAFSVTCQKPTKTIKPGSTVNFTLTVENDGNVDEAEVRVAVSSPGSGWDMTFIDMDSGEPLQMGTFVIEAYSTKEIRFSLTAPDHIDAGERARPLVTMTMKIPDDDDLRDSVELLATVEEYYAVSLTTVSKARRSDPGSLEEFFVTVTNTGNMEQDIEIIQSTTGADWPFIIDGFPVSKVRMEPQATRDFTVSCDVPLDADFEEVSGTILTARVYETGGSWRDATGTLELEITSEESFFINAIVVDGSVEIDPGDTDSVKIRLENLGNRANTMNISVKTPFEWEGLLSQTEATLGPGSSKVINLQLTPPDDERAGAAQGIRVTVFSENDDDQSVEIAVPVAVSLAPDFMLIDRTADDLRIRIGRNGYAEVEVDNTGNGDLVLTATIDQVSGDTPWEYQMSEEYLNISYRKERGISITLSPPKGTPSEEEATFRITVSGHDLEKDVTITATAEKAGSGDDDESESSSTMVFMTIGFIAILICAALFLFVSKQSTSEDDTGTGSSFGDDADEQGPANISAPVMTPELQALLASRLSDEDNSDEHDGDDTSDDISSMPVMTPELEALLKARQEQEDTSQEREEDNDINKDKDDKKSDLDGSLEDGKDPLSEREIEDEAEDVAAPKIDESTDAITKSEPSATEPEPASDLKDPEPNDPVARGGSEANEKATDKETPGEEQSVESTPERTENAAAPSPKKVKKPKDKNSCPGCGRKLFRKPDDETVKCMWCGRTIVYKKSGK